MWKHRKEPHSGPESTASHPEMLQPASSATPMVGRLYSLADSLGMLNISSSRTGLCTRHGRQFYDFGTKERMYKRCRTAAQVWVLQYFIVVFVCRLDLGRLAKSTGWDWTAFMHWLRWRHTSSGSGWQAQQTPRIHPVLKKDRQCTPSSGWQTE
jgi:hypothetical protein